MRTFLFIALAVLGAGCNASGACEDRSDTRASCVDVGQRACEPMVARGAVFHSGTTCEDLGYTVCDANGCRRP